MGGRFAFLIGIVGIMYGFLLYHLYGLQVVHGDYYTAKIDSVDAIVGTILPERGSIFFTDKLGERVPVALQKDFPEIFADPSKIKDPETTAVLVAPILGEDPERLAEEFSSKENKYKLLASDPSTEMIRGIEETRVKGVQVVERARRFYPLGPLAAHVLGFVGPDATSNAPKGHYGVEEFYDKLLAGTQGSLEAGARTPPVDGKALTLTLDPSIQSEAERIVETLIKTHRAESGGAIVMDPATGKILAMVSRPNFDPNAYAKHDLAVFKNRMIQEAYEPGSVVKVLTMASGLDAGVVTPETTYMDRGKLTMNTKTIRNSDYDTKGARGRQTMTNVIEQSLNTGAVFVQQQLGRTKFTEYMHAFELGDKTGVDALGEVKGDLRQLNAKVRDIAFATAAYGQGMTATPLGLLTAIAAIANGGHLMRPYLNAELLPHVRETVLKSESAAQVRAMMVSAVEKAKVATIKGYSIAGKTGTAYIPDFKKGGYTDEVVNTYVGFAPATNPKFIVLIKLDKPAGAPVAALTVVPAFRELAQFILNYYAISPDQL